MDYSVSNDTDESYTHNVELKRLHTVWLLNDSIYMNFKNTQN